MDTSTSGSGSGFMDDMFTCTDPSLISSNNVSNTTFWTIREDITSGGFIPAALVFGIMWIFAFGWNLFILVMYCYKYHLLKHPANIYLFSLALNDFLFSIVVLPGAVITYAAHEFIIGSSDKVRCGFCYFQGFIMSLGPVLSLTILAVLSVDRCCLLSDPIRYKKRESSILGIVIMIAVWIFIMILCVLPAFEFGEWEFNRNLAICVVRFTPNRNLRYMVVIVLYALIPIIILAVTNIWTYKIVSKFLRRRLRRRRSYRGSFRERNEDNTQHQHQQAQLVKLFGALFVANIVVWSPAIVMVFVVLGIGGERVPGWPYIIFLFIVASNTVIHPVLESLFNKELRLVVAKGRKKVSQKVRSTSRSLIRLATRESMPKIPLSESSHIGNDNLTDVTEATSSPSLSARFSTTPEIKRGDAFEKVRKTGAPPSPLLKQQTAPVFNYSSIENSTKTHSLSEITSPATVSSSMPTSPLTELQNSSNPSTPLTPGKRRQVSISLPDDDNVYYPTRERTPTLIQRDTVFEDDNSESIEGGDSSTKSKSNQDSGSENSSLHVDSNMKLNGLMNNHLSEDPFFEDDNDCTQDDKSSSTKSKSNKDTESENSSLHVDSNIKLDGNTSTDPLVGTDGDELSDNIQLSDLINDKLYLETDGHENLV